MIKFKELLKENNGGDKKELYNLLSSGKYYITEKPVYRGMSSEIDTFVKRSPRKRGGSRNTNQGTHELVSIVVKQFYPNHPDREKASFGAFEYSFANRFGNYVNIMVPKKSAKTRFYSFDTWTRHLESISDKITNGTRHFNSLDYSRLKEAFDILEEEYQNETVIDFVRGVYLLYSYNKDFLLKDVLDQYDDIASIIQDLKEINKFIQINWDEIGNETKRIDYGFYQVMRGIKKLKKYFEDASKKPKEFETSQEVIIEGEHLIINREWFKNNFNWNGGNIELL